MSTPFHARPGIRADLLPARSHHRSLVSVVVIALLLIGTIVFWKLSPIETVPPVDDGVVVVAGDMPAITAPVAGVGIELRGVFVGGTPAASSATIGSGDQVATVFRIGDTISPGVTLAEVHDDHVVLMENGLRSELYLLGGGAVAGPVAARKGLDPEPVRPSGELSAEEIIARVDAAGAEPVRKTPEEEAAGR